MIDIQMLLTIPLSLVLAQAARVDMREKRLPDYITLPLVAAGLGLAWLGVGEPLSARLIGAVSGFLLFWAIGNVVYLRSGVDGLGLGDAKLFAAAGAWLGYAALPAVLLIASLGGLAQAYATGKTRGQQIAFGPWLALGFLIGWLWQSFAA